MIAQSVEQRICDLQNRKQNMADNSFGEGKGKRSSPPLSIIIGGVLREKSRPRPSDRRRPDHALFVVLQPSREASPSAVARRAGHGAATCRTPGCVKRPQVRQFAAYPKESRLGQTPAGLCFAFRTYPIPSRLVSSRPVLVVRLAVTSFAWPSRLLAASRCNVGLSSSSAWEIDRDEMSCHREFDVGPFPSALPLFELSRCGGTCCDKRHGEEDV